MLPESSNLLLSLPSEKASFQYFRIFCFQQQTKEEFRLGKVSSTYGYKAISHNTIDMIRLKNMHIRCEIVLKYMKLQNKLRKITEDVKNHV